jgi:hypothetical protein
MVDQGIYFIPGKGKIFSFSFSKPPDRLWG